MPLLDLTGSVDGRNLMFPAGHIGSTVSVSAHKKLWPEVGAWLAERDN
jgi:polyhydroxyalkanoate synthase